MSFQANLTQAALANTFFRKVLYTTPLTQVVVMHVNPGEDIGLETHTLDQVLCFVAGSAEVVLDGNQGVVSAGDVVVVPAGTRHNFTTLGAEPLKLYTVYAPPEHAPGTVHRTKADAEAAEAAEHGQPAPSGAKAPVARLTVGSLIGKAQ